MSLIKLLSICNQFKFEAINLLLYKATSDIIYCYVLDPPINGVTKLFKVNWKMYFS